MRKYYFKKEDGKYIWYSPELKLVFSNISFQAHDEYGFLKSIDGILYLYYTIEVYRMEYGYDEEGGHTHKWKLVSKKNTYDFPTITELKYVLEQYLENKIPLDKCRLVHYYHCGEVMKDRVGYQHSMDTGGVLYDDCYQIERTIVKEHNREIAREYYLYVGCSLNPQGGGASAGVKTDITEGGLRCLHQCITEFLDEAIESHNEAIRKEISKIVYSVDENNRLIKIEDGKITELFMEGEKVDSICIYRGDLNSEDFYSESYNDVILSKFNKDKVTFTNGYCEHRNKDYNKLNSDDRIITIPVKNVLYVFTDVDEPVLSLKEEDIAEDLKKILTDEELTEIKSSPLRNMYKKWYEMIVDRYIIFRDEHHFREIKEDKRENKKEAVKTILKLLKKK